MGLDVEALVQDVVVLDAVAVLVRDVVSLDAEDQHVVDQHVEDRHVVGQHVADLNIQHENCFFFLKRTLIWFQTKSF